MHLSRANLNDNDRKKVLEMFVENDDALGQLLDFISSHYINPKPPAAQDPEQPSLTTVTSNRSGPKTSININTSQQLQREQDLASLRISNLPRNLPRHQRVINVQSNDNGLVRGDNSGGFDSS